MPNYRYLVTHYDKNPFLTNVFDYENNFIPLEGMVVYDLVEKKWIDDFGKWTPIEEDTL